MTPHRAALAARGCLSAPCRLRRRRRRAPIGRVGLPHAALVDQRQPWSGATLPRGRSPGCAVISLEGARDQLDRASASRPPSARPAAPARRHRRRRAPGRRALPLLGRAAGRRVAGRQDHPVGVELEGGDLGGARGSRRRVGGAHRAVPDRAASGSGRARPTPLSLAGQRAVGGEMHDAVVGEPAARLAP